MINGIQVRFNRVLFFGLLMVISLAGFSQTAEQQNDSLYSSRLMQANLELYGQIDSLNLIIRETKLRNVVLVRQIDSLKIIVDQLQGEMVLSKTKIDTLLMQKLRNIQELLGLKQQLLLTGSTIEEKLQLVREKEYQLNECQIELREAKSEASLKQAKLEGKIDVNNTKVEAKDREIAYMNETIDEKDRIIAEKTAELSQFYRDKSNTLRLVDSLARALNAKELELVKVSERLKIIESQYNELLAQRTAAQNKKKKVRFVQGVALKNYRTPDFQLAPKSSVSTATYVITNKNSGKLEFDYITGVSLSLFDLSKPESKYTYDAGLFFGFGGTNLFKNFYVSPSFKAFDFFHFMVGLNIAEYQQLQSGFNEGDVLPPGMGIPTVKEWKANMFFGMTIDFELLSNIPKKM